jgi:Flp pilus assembly protein TadD
MNIQTTLNRGACSARALVAMWRMSEAEEALQRATVLSQEAAEARSNLAYVQAIRGRLDASLSNSRHASPLRRT